MTGGERTSLDSLDAFAPLADLGTVVESGAGGAGAGVPDMSANGPKIPGRGKLVLLRSPEVAKGPAGTMVTGYSLL